VNPLMTKTAPSDQRDYSLNDLTRKMRVVLGSGELASEDERKAALRRLIHEHAAGLTSDEIEEMISAVRGRFPDRIFESVSTARNMTSRLKDLEEEVGRLREERDLLRQRNDHFESLMTRLSQAATTPAGKTPGTIGGSLAKQTLAPESLDRLAEVAVLLFTFALNQEETARSIEETIGQEQVRGQSDDLATLIPSLVDETSADGEATRLIRKRLRSLQLMPGALLAGAQQSWKGGTREILEYLDPKAAEENLSGVLKFTLILKEVKRRFEEFWSQFDRNVEHYYRGRFERVYQNKMEDHS